MSLLTSEDIEIWLPHIEAGSPVVYAAIPRAEALAEAYCDRGFAEVADGEDWFSPVPGMEVLVLRRSPITKITAVVEAASSDNPTTLAATQYTYEPDSGRVYRREGYWCAGPRAVKITYTGGYTSATCPYTLKNALCELVAWIIGRRGGHGVAQESMDGYSAQHREVVGGMPRDIATMFDPYRRVSLR